MGTKTIGTIDTITTVKAWYTEDLGSSTMIRLTLVMINQVLGHSRRLKLTDN